MNKRDLQSIIAEVIQNTNKAAKVSADVQALDKAQTSAAAVAAKAKNINTPQEFEEAFERWFPTLGFQPGKITKTAARQSVEKVLTKLGYK